MGHRAHLQCSESDGALYDAHIRAVKLQAKTTGKAEVDLFHNLCWGHGKVALGRYPPELDGADAANQSVSVTHVLAWTTGHMHSRNTGHCTRGVVCVRSQGKASP